VVEATRQGQQVRQGTDLMLPSGNAACICVAQGLGLGLGLGRSMRTLQRELDGEGLSFTGLL
jgi:hypothetical protein